MGPSMQPSIGEHSLTAMDLSEDSLNSHGSFIALAGMGFCLPSRLGGQAGQELQLCLGILEDPVSTNKWTGVKVDSFPLPSGWVPSICLTLCGDP